MKLKIGFENRVDVVSFEPSITLKEAIDTISEGNTEGVEWIKVIPPEDWGKKE